MLFSIRSLILILYYYRVKLLLEEASEGVCEGDTITTGLGLGLADTEAAGVSDGETNGLGLGFGFIWLWEPVVAEVDWLILALLTAMAVQEKFISEVAVLLSLMVNPEDVRS